jgi:hypothetical protein
MIGRACPAVFACPARIRNRAKLRIISSSSHYPAWPEIADPSNFYTLPTLSSLPDIQIAMYLPYYVKSYDLKAFIAEPQSSKEVVYYDDYLDEDLNIYTNSTPFFYNLGCSVDDPTWTTFAFLHDVGHYQSFMYERPTITNFNNFASNIFALLKPTGITQCSNFLEEFHEHNDALTEFIKKSLILEEVRANLFAWESLDYGLWAAIDDEMRKILRKDGTLCLFRKLASLGDGYKAFWLTIKAEETNLDDPISGVNSLMRKPNWLQSFKYEIDYHRYEPAWLLSFYRSASKVSIEGSRSGITDELWYLPAHVKEAIFLESIRQQLAQWSGLVCPFQEPYRTFRERYRKKSACCGFGHNLRYVWEHLPQQTRYPKSVISDKTGEKLFFNRPPSVCLNYGFH